MTMKGMKRKCVQEREWGCGWRWNVGNDEDDDVEEDQEIEEDKNEHVN